MKDIYIPIFYIERVKRPGKKVFLNTIIKNHLITLILALSWLSPAPIIHGASMFFLVLSFWCIYEIGYYENDQIAERYEHKPTLSETYQLYKAKKNTWQPWFWSLLFSMPGFALLEVSKLSSWPFNNLLHPAININIDLHFFRLYFFIWLGVLLLTRATFFIYNCLDKQTRKWLYPILQICKYFGFSAISITNLVGTALLFTQVLAEWVPYLIYRIANAEYDDFQNHMFRAVMFLCLSLALAIGLHNFSIVANFQFLAMLVWCFMRTRNQLKDIADSAYPIWKDKSV